MKDRKMEDLLRKNKEVELVNKNIALKQKSRLALE
jgi:hypothetical protein